MTPPVEAVNLATAQESAWHGQAETLAQLSWVDRCGPPGERVAQNPCRPAVTQAAHPQMTLVQTVNLAK